MSLKIEKYTPFEWIIIGFIFHAGGSLFNDIKLINYSLCGLGLILILYNSILRVHTSKMPFNGFVRLLFYFYIIWIVYIIIKPFSTTEVLRGSGSFSPISPYLLLSYATPFFAFLGIKNLSLKSVFKFSYIYGIIGIILLILNYRNVFTINPQIFDSEEYQGYIQIIGVPHMFLYSTSFMMLCFAFVVPKYRWLAFICMFLALFTVMFTARRSGVFIDLLIFIFTFYLYTFESKEGSKILKVLFVLAIIGTGFIVFYMYFDTTFSLLFSRLDEDTRSGVEDYFYSSFNGKTSDWIVGRGINGFYFSPFAGDVDRQIIETGYLQLILKGGIINLILFVFFLLHSAFLGFFRTKNVLTKAMALYLLAHVIYLIPFGLPTFSFEYIIVWVCVVYCQSKDWRMKNNSAIIEYLEIENGQKRANIGIVDK